MELTKQCCSLELAQKLKNLGVKQESYFIWTNPRKGVLEVERNVVKYHNMDSVVASAFTVAELGEMLPEMSCVTWKTKYGYACREDSLTNGGDIFFEENTEADARAKMLVYLLENGLITL